MEREVDSTDLALAAGWEREARLSETNGWHHLAANARRIAADYREGRVTWPAAQPIRPCVTSQYYA